MSKASSLSHGAMRKAAVRLVTGSTVLREEAAVKKDVLIPMYVRRECLADTERDY